MHVWPALYQRPYLSNPFNLLLLILTTQSQRTRYLSHKMKSKPFYAVLLEWTLFIHTPLPKLHLKEGKPRLALNTLHKEYTASPPQAQV